MSASMRNSTTCLPRANIPARKGFPTGFSRSRVQRQRLSGFRRHDELTVAAGYDGHWQPRDVGRHVNLPPCHTM